MTDWLGSRLTDSLMHWPIIEKGLTKQHTALNARLFECIYIWKQHTDWPTNRLNDWWIDQWFKWLVGFKVLTQTIHLYQLKKIDTSYQQKNTAKWCEKQKKSQKKKRKKNKTKKNKQTNKNNNINWRMNEEKNEWLPYLISPSILSSSNVLYIHCNQILTDKYPWIWDAFFPKKPKPKQRNKELNINLIRKLVNITLICKIKLLHWTIHL